MKQILFIIPFLNRPIYGFGVMMLVALLVCIEMASRMMKRSGGNPSIISDLLPWLFIPGIFGARLFYVLQYWKEFENPFLEFFAIWNGGLVVYGSALGALSGFLVFTYRRKIPRFWLLDMIAPVMVLGVGIGRIGCLLNGCCYGDYCEQPWAITFPDGSAPFKRMVERGHQSRLGFTLDPIVPVIKSIESDTPAEKMGLRIGDRITAVGRKEIQSTREFFEEVSLFAAEEHNKTPGPPPPLAPIPLTVRSGQADFLRSVASPRSLPVHPTQIYSAIDGFLMFAWLYFVWRTKNRDGVVIACMAMGYGMTRFLVESLRYDEAFLADGLTISQNISILMFLAGAAVWVYTYFSPTLFQPTGDLADLIESTETADQKT